MHIHHKKNYDAQKELQWWSIIIRVTNKHKMC